MFKKRKRKSNKILLGLIILLATVSLLSFKRLYDANAFRDFRPHSPPCAPIKGIPGAEDIAISKDGYVFLSTLDRRSQAYDQKWKEGAIYGLDLSKPVLEPVNLTSDFSEELHPRGLALYEGQGETTLFVINYRMDGYYIETFKWQDGKLLHQNSLQSELFNQPSHIAAIDHKHFYVSNERGLYTPTGHFIEEFFNLSTADIIYYDGKAFKIAAKSLAHPSGIYAENGRVFVTELIGKSVKIFQRNTASGNLTLKEKIPLDTFASNIKGDGSGVLWVTAHPQLLSYQSHAMNPQEITAPSQVLRLHPQATASFSYKIEEFLLSLSGPLSGATVAIPFQNHLLLGAAFEDKLLICQTDREDLALK